jgi:essential nuclear protein 1
MSSEKPERVTLADRIFEKIREKGQDLTSDTIEKKFDPRVVHSYRAVGKLLSTYSVGKVPKAFKIIPSLVSWEEILLFTNPDEWSPQATYQATKLFASNMNPKMAQRFYNMILLPAVRNDIQEHKKLNYHLFMSLKKSIYKPSAFFKGILLPIAESKSCSLKEAVILGSVISRITIPVLHAAAALLKLAEMEYSGTNSYFVRVLIEKKFTLPYRVVDALAIHFSRFMKEERTLPVLWHQSLLAFVETYKTDLTVEQNAALSQLIKKHTHHLITANIRRELSLSLFRGDNPDCPQPMNL